MSDLQTLLGGVDSSIGRGVGQNECTGGASHASDPGSIPVRVKFFSGRKIDIGVVSLGKRLHTIFHVLSETDVD